MEMTETINTALERFNQGDLDGYLQTLYTRDVQLHYLPPGMPGDLSGARSFYQMVMHAFPGVQVVAQDFITDGDRLVVRFRMSGTQQGDFMGIPPSNRSFSVEGITLMRFSDGKCVERWSETDMLGLMMQIGAEPN